MLRCTELDKVWTRIACCSQLAVRPLRKHSTAAALRLLAHDAARSWLMDQLLLITTEVAIRVPSLTLLASGVTSRMAGRLATVRSTDTTNDEQRHTFVDIRIRT